VIHDEPEDDFMLQHSFLSGISRLESFGLVYDLLLFPRHLKNAVKLAARFPKQRFVLDHLAKPPIEDGGIQPWKEDLEELAKLPNIWCKMSGMVTEANHQSWRYGDFVPYLEVVLQTFGTGRVMLGSDWPVCTLAASYAETMHIPLRFCEGWNTQDKEQLYRLNAINCYQLKV
jgi:L-fuconolactonase